MTSCHLEMSQPVMLPSHRNFFSFYVLPETTIMKPQPSTTTFTLTTLFLATFFLISYFRRIEIIFNCYVCPSNRKFFDDSIPQHNQLCVKNKYFHYERDIFSDAIACRLEDANVKVFSTCTKLATKFHSTRKSHGFMQSRLC